MRSLELAWQIFSTVKDLPDVTRKQVVTAYEVGEPTTVYIRASYSRVIVQRTTERRVQIACDLRHAFGWEWVTERDDAGIYVVLKRKPVVGVLSSAELVVTVPPDAYLVFNLTPGSVHLADFDGRLSVAPVDDSGVTDAVVTDGFAKES